MLIAQFLSARESLRLCFIHELESKNEKTLNKLKLIVSAIRTVVQTDSWDAKSVVNETKISLHSREATIWPADKDDVMSAKYLPSKVITWISGASTLLIGKWSGGIFSLN